MKKLFLIRHGPTHVKRLIGHTDVDVDLSNHERIQNTALFLPRDAVMISSDLRRAKYTADALLQTQQRLDHDPDLREYNFGEWENADFDMMDAHNQEKLREFYENPGHTAPPGGESWYTVERRVCSRIEAYLQKHDTVIIVAHMGVILAYLRSVTGKSPYEVLAQKIEPLSVTWFEDDGDGMHLKEVNRLF